MKKLIFCLSLMTFACGERTAEKTADVPTEKVIEKKEFPEKIIFSSLDSVPVYANLYHCNDTAPVIVLCHQARFNKFEYHKIAETLCAKGYNCLAIDQRSGGPIVETFNETMLKAKEKGKPVDFLDAEQDIVAAVNFASKKYRKKLILWGSSYSSTLVLYIAIVNDEVDAVISFSPGDYFVKEKGALTEKLAAFKKPMFLTSSKEESVELSQMLSKTKLGDKQLQFIPKAPGEHGSRALWKTSESNEEYWAAINSFLASVN